MINFPDQQAEVQLSANRQSFPQRPAQHPPTNAKVLSAGSGSVSAQMSSMFGPSHSQPLLQGHGGGSTSSSNNNRPMNDLPGVCASVDVHCLWCLVFSFKEIVLSAAPKRNSEQSL